MTRQGMPSSYERIHDLLRDLHGPASEHTCSCGEPAKQWAYQHTGDPEIHDSEGRSAHSLDPNDYMPMCQSCHRAFDLEHDDAMKAKMLAGQRRGGAVASRIRRRCRECGMVSRPGAIGKHQKFLGHEGYDDTRA